MNEQHTMTTEPTMFVCEECGIEYNPDEEGSDGMCEDCYDDTFENYGADDEWTDDDE